MVKINERYSISRENGVFLIHSNLDMDSEPEVYQGLLDAYIALTNDGESGEEIMFAAHKLLEEVA